MKAYKATDHKMQCRGYQFELNKEYSIEGKLELCENGFHFCKEFKNINTYYQFHRQHRYFEVEILGDVIDDGDKSCTNKIKFIRELTDEELLEYGIERSGNRISYNGSKAWYLNRLLHREDGPAVEYADGYKAWFVNGECHREDGPAVEWADGTKEWWFKGKELTEQEFNARTKSCDGEIITHKGKDYRLTLVK